MAERVGIFTYNGLDGACAAAAVLLKYPGASLTVTSAGRVAESMEDVLKKPGPAPAGLYVCGLGIKCDWERLQDLCERLKLRRIDVLWFCGRGYLDGYRERLDAFCRPVFNSAGSNTGAVCGHLGIAGGGCGRRLMDLALLDPNLRAGGEEACERPDCTEERRFWIDLVEAAISQYFKYQDPDAYKRVIRHLSTGQAGESDRKLVEIYRRHGGGHALMGKSEAMKRLRGRIRLVADADEHVLVTGESGVGKEYVARLIHEAGRRTMEPIVTVNCAVFAGSEGLANSVLFGHVKGAFTGAVAERDGAFVAADGGVLFLDELGTMPLEIQGKFLRVIEDGWVTPVGLDRPLRQVDVRVIAATNREMPRMVRDGEFREDLFHRLDVLRIRLPSLREHKEDIAYIADHLLRNVTGRGIIARLSDEEKAALESYDWPGNVRQLGKVIKRAKLLDMALKEVLVEEKQYLEAGSGDDSSVLPRVVEDITGIREIQRRYAVHAFKLNGENLADTARRLNISPNTLKKHLSAHLRPL